MHLEGGVADVPVYDRATLGAGDRFAGPAIITQLDATTFVAPGWSGEVHAGGALLLTVSALPPGRTRAAHACKFDGSPELQPVALRPRHD